MIEEMTKVRELLASLAEIWDVEPGVSRWVRQDGPEAAVQRAAAGVPVRDGAEVLADAQAAGLRLVLMGDPDYPARLDGVEGAPVGLWARGDVSLLAGGAVAVTGSSVVTDYGRHVAAEIGQRLARRGVQVVTRGGLGVDQAVAGAVTAEMIVDGVNPGAVTGRSVVVQACGLDYRHTAPIERLLHQSVRDGVIVSPYRPGLVETRYRRLRRQWLLAALADAVVIVESPLRSTALAAGEHALSLGRPLGVVPGPVTSSNSAGCHALLRSQPSAVLVRGADDVVDLLA